LGRELGARPGDPHGVTMTAELSQLFRTKRDGVAFVLDAVTQAFPDGWVRVYAVDGGWRTADEARRDPLAVAAANWAATARLVARRYPDCILIDVGSTTTDIVPIVGGVSAAVGRTDPERLREQELVYTGVLRTPAEAIAATVPLGGRPTGVSAEGFALAGDVHVWRGQLAPRDYSVPTPDGRPVTRALARERRARGGARPRRPPRAGGGGGATARDGARHETGARVTDEPRVVHTVVKVGGGLLSKAGALDLVIEALTAFGPRRRLVIVPGGGPFAEAARTMFPRMRIREEAAHGTAGPGLAQCAPA